MNTILSKRRRCIITISGPNQLKNQLWVSSGPAQRSTEITPLYIERYIGSNRCPVLTQHSFWELIFIFKGHGIMRGNPDCPFEASTAFLIPPHASHCEESNETFDCLYIGLHGSRVKSLDRRAVFHVKNQDLASSFERLWLRAQNPFGRIGPEMDGLTLVVFNEFLRGHDPFDPSSTNRIFRVTSYLRQHFNQNISMSQVARQFGCSESFFYREFRKLSGMTPIHYLTDIRIRQAIHWLQGTRLPISHIAELVGYRDPLYFGRVFHKVTGYRPSQIRHASPNCLTLDDHVAKKRDEGQRGERNVSGATGR